MADPDLNDVALFVRVIDRAGFSRVARELRVPASTVSRAVSRLEDTLGTQLVQRTTRAVHPTAEGRAFYAEVAPAIATLHHAARGVDGADRSVRGRLRITAPNDIGSTFVADVVVEFSQRCPNVDVELELTSRTVNLTEEGFDVAIRAAQRLPDSSLVARKVGELDGELYASTAYVQTHGMPTSPEALAEHPCVLFRAPGGATTWSLRGPHGDLDVPVRGRIAGDDYTFVRSAVLAGAGVAEMPRIIAAPDVAAGRLVRVMPDYVRRGASLYVLHPGARRVPARVTAFGEFIVEAFARRQGATAAAPARTKRAR